VPWQPGPPEPGRAAAAGLGGLGGLDDQPGRLPAVPTALVRPQAAIPAAPRKAAPPVPGWLQAAPKAALARTKAALWQPEPPRTLPTSTRPSTGSSSADPVPVVPRVSLTLLSYGRELGEPRGLAGRTDCEGDLADPHALTRCCGCSGAVQFNISQHPRFSRVMQSVYAGISAAMAERPAGAGPRQLAWGMRCRRGKHRSVAMAELTAFCAHRGWPEVSVSVRHRDMMACGCPGFCRYMTPTQSAQERQDRVDACNRAWTCWASDQETP
jgi:hypothetical protein